MGLFGQSKKEKELQLEINRLRALIPPEGHTVMELQQQINTLTQNKAQIESALREVQKNLEKEESHLNALQFQQQNIQKNIVNLQEEVELQEFGIYQPTYKFANSDLYKEQLNKIRQQQKDMIKNNTACTGNMNWTVNGSVSKGKKMVKDMQKLLLRAFNVECDDIITHVKISNFEKSIQRIDKIAEQISKLGEMMYISITHTYVYLKKQELSLALDFEQKKQEEKEQIKEARERQREEAKIQKEIEEARKKLLKEQTHYQNALATINEQLKQHPDNADLIAKQQELQANIEDTQKAMADVDYREANKRAGYVYIISNVGAFGKNVYKIGMTRRLEPQERIDELSGASVPFNFDIHALIFSEDAPALETALHHAFENKKINKVNSRREFFRVSLDEIKKEVRKNFDKTVEWIDFPEAEQFRQSVLQGSSDTIEDATNMFENNIVSTTIQSTISRQPRPITNSIEQLKSVLTDYEIKEEDTPAFFRLHIYKRTGQKLGTIKITKPDMTDMQFKQPGNPTLYTLTSADDIKNYL